MAKFRLLNSAELQPVEGGENELQATCTKSGDTLLKGFRWKIVYCLTVEMKCESGFSFDCSSLTEHSVSCGSGYASKTV